MKLTERLVMTTIDWAYEKAIQGIPGFDSAEKLGRKYLERKGTLHDQINALIRSQTMKAGASGFVSGLGGAVVLPFSLPANFTSVIYMQIRMVAAIAYMGGYELSDSKVRTFILVCIAGKPAEKALREMGVSFGVKITKEIIKSVCKKSATKVNQSLTTRLLTKVGLKQGVTVAKIVPLVGGVIGGAFDGVATNAIGGVARDMFVGKPISLELSKDKTLSDSTQ